MMDTIVTITTTGDSKTQLQDATARAFTLFQTIANETDPYTAQGPQDLYAINQAAGKGPQKASPYLLDILQQIAPLHNAPLDVTLGPVIQVWNQHRDSKTVPTAEEIHQALAKCGPDKYTVSQENGTITLANGAQLDLGAVAKGYAVEQTPTSWPRSQASKRPW